MRARTIFTASIGNKVLFGNNEDYSNPNTYHWVVPPSDGNYGGVYFGFDNFWPQGGVNEMGLAFDINALEEAPLNPHPELSSMDDYEGYLVLRNCATVEEAIELVKKYNWGEAMWGQIHFADATGDAVVVSAGKDKELAFTRKKNGDGFPVSTNFNLAFYREDEREGLCWRYNKAVEMLEKIDGEEDLIVEYFREISDAVHVEGASVNTLRARTMGNARIAAKNCLTCRKKLRSTPLKEQHIRPKRHISMYVAKRGRLSYRCMHARQRSDPFQNAYRKKRENNV